MARKLRDSIQDVEEKRSARWDAERAMADASAQLTTARGSEDEATARLKRDMGKVAGVYIFTRPDGSQVGYLRDGSEKGYTIVPVADPDVELPDEPDGGTDTTAGGGGGEATTPGGGGGGEAGTAGGGTGGVTVPETPAGGGGGGEETLMPGGGPDTLIPGPAPDTVTGGGEVPAPFARPAPSGSPRPGGRYLKP